MGCFFPSTEFSGILAKHITEMANSTTDLDTATIAKDCISRSTEFEKKDLYRKRAPTKLEMKAIKVSRAGGPRK
jgi:hypothetical protein